MKNKPEVGDNVEVFEDPITQLISEGLAKIVNIHSDNNGVLSCDVRFYIHKDDTKRSKLEDSTHFRIIKY